MLHFTTIYNYVRIYQNQIKKHPDKHITTPRMHRSPSLWHHNWFIYLLCPWFHW